MSAPTAARAAWVCRCVHRLTRLHARGVSLPTGDRPLTWYEYTRLIELVMAEYRED
jgi:hypothetical protein